MTSPDPAGSRTIDAVPESPAHAAQRPSAAVGPRPRPTSRDRRRSPLGWLPWALLAGILALVALMVLAGFLAGRGGDAAGGASTGSRADAGASDRSAAGPQGSADGAVDGQDQASVPGADAADPAAGESGAGGQLLVGQTDVLGDPSGAAGLAGLQGRPATGRAVLVESVVADEGFWVGPGTDQRVFVQLLPEARGGEGESPFQVTAGQRLDLEGTVVALEQGGAEELGVTGPEDRTQLERQSSYVQASAVRLAD